MDPIPPAPAPRPDSPPSPARPPRRSTADYRWTQPKVLAFLDALSRCGRVDEAARAVGMSRTSAYRLRARMASARFDAAFEGARRTGLRARAEASAARLARAPSVCEGPGIAAMAQRERSFAEASQGHTSAAQGDTLARQGDTLPSQGDALATQGCTLAHKVARKCAR